MDTLRARGKKDEAIELLRHLPFLVHRAGVVHPLLTPNSVSIYFNNGETCLEVMETLLDTPGHVIWLAEADSRAGNSLLLDTVTCK